MKQLVYIIGLIVVLSFIFRVLLSPLGVVLTAAVVVATLFFIDKSPNKIK